MEKQSCRSNPDAQKAGVELACFHILFDVSFWRKFLLSSWNIALMCIQRVNVRCISVYFNSSTYVSTIYNKSALFLFCNCGGNNNKYIKIAALCNSKYCNYVVMYLNILFSQSIPRKCSFRNFFCCRKLLILQLSVMINLIYKTIAKVTNFHTALSNTYYIMYVT